MRSADCPWSPAEAHLCTDPFGRFIRRGHGVHETQKVACSKGAFFEGIAARGGWSGLHAGDCPLGATGGSTRFRARFGETRWFRGHSVMRNRRSPSGLGGPTTSAMTWQRMALDYQEMWLAASEVIWR
jgi:hypothetical protein